MQAFGFVFLIPWGYFIAGFLGIDAQSRGLFAVPCALVLVIVLNRTLPRLWKLTNSSIRVTWFFTHYAADRAIPVSHVEAMISNGHYDDATNEIDALLAKHGVDPVICQLAIDHHLGRNGSRERGEALLRRMRNENPKLYEGMATQRLIDLYMMQPETHGKAITELRRLASRFPGTREADGALECIRQLRLQHDPQAVGHVRRTSAEVA